RSEQSKLLVPKAQEQQRANDPLGNSQEPAGSANAENRIHPKNERPVTDVRYQNFGFILKPFLITKEHKYNNHGNANYIVIQIMLEKTGFGKQAYEIVHCRFLRGAGTFLPDGKLRKGLRSSCSIICNGRTDLLRLRLACVVALPEVQPPRRQRTRKC